MTYRGKRWLDLALSTPIAVVTLPLQGVAALAVRVTLGTPVLFRQLRPGLDGEPFTMLKFRTMHPVHAGRGQLDDASRLTKFGAFLRSSSIDELPALWNVIRGDMSLVGPRPLLVEYLSLYDDRQARRHDVLPGLTGLAQIRGRNSVTWEQRFRDDLEYVENQSFALDLRILLTTVLTVLRQVGISGEGEATMRRFAGNTGVRG